MAPRFLQPEQGGLGKTLSVLRHCATTKKRWSPQLSLIQSSGPTKSTVVLCRTLTFPRTTGRTTLSVECARSNFAPVADQTPSIVLIGTEDRRRTADALDVCSRPEACIKGIAHAGGHPWYDKENPTNSCYLMHGNAEKPYHFLIFKSV